MPALFLGHGNPMNALQSNDYTHAWAAIGQNLPRPRAVLMISAHWYIRGTFVTAMRTPRTIHDFGGFPQALYEIHYPAPGDPELAAHIADLLAPVGANLDQHWGLDHGAWSVLCHVFPGADIPVVQLSIDKTQAADFHYQTGKLLAPLRNENILIIGSGNIVHNLHTYAWGKQNVAPHDWAERFETRVRDALLTSNDTALINYETLDNEAMLAVPTPDHYLPFLYILGLRQKNETVSFPVEGFDGGSISMLAIQLG